MASQEHTPGSPQLSVAKTDAEAPLAPEATPFLYLEIRRGRTGHPQRPVLTRDFLIGSGPECDLRLGGEEIPPAHSMLLIGEEEVRIQWLAETPQLLLNGELIHEEAVSEGDEIRIGRFEFVVHGLQHPLAENKNPEFIPLVKEAAEAADAAPTPADLMNLVAQAKEAEGREHISEMSPAELLEQIEADQQAVDEFEDGVRQGESALLFALAERAENLLDDDEPVEPPAAQDSPGEPIDAEILLELEKVIEQLSGFSAELDERAARIANQEATQTEAAELLLDAQRELAAQLERFHQQVADSQETAVPTLRKAA